MTIVRDDRRHRQTAKSNLLSGSGFVSMRGKGKTVENVFLRAST
jgi:hypothetical protein